MHNPTCSTCKGTGRIADDIPCAACGGSGALADEQRRDEVIEALLPLVGTLIRKTDVR